MIKKTISVIILLLFLTGCFGLDIEVLIQLGNETCNLNNEKYVNVIQPTISENYYKIYCLNQDRTEIKRYIILPEEYEQYKKSYISDLE